MIPVPAVVSQSATLAPKATTAPVSAATVAAAAGSAGASETSELLAQMAAAGQLDPRTLLALQRGMAQRRNILGGTGQQSIDEQICMALPFFHSCIHAIHFRTCGCGAVSHVGPCAALGFMQVNTGNYAAGIEVFNTVLQQRPGVVGALLGRGTAYAMQGDLPQVLLSVWFILLSLFCLSDVAVYMHHNRPLWTSVLRFESDPKCADAWKRRAQVHISPGCRIHTH